MGPETILKITDIWVNCTTDVQMTLIRKYFVQLDSGTAAEWAEYLADEFGESRISRPAVSIPD